jgi:hypothetical protein
MKKVLNQSEQKQTPKAVKTYKKPQIIATTGKASMSGAGCPTHTVQWQQVSCKC